MNSVSLPLADVTVVAVEQYGAGPWATMQLADLGARIIKVEDPRVGGDVGRYVPPYQSGEDSLFFEAFNRGKDSISLDLKSDAGQEVLRTLVKRVDAVFCNLRGTEPERLGLTYAQLGAINPQVVCCSLTGYGRTGPRAGEGAYDYVIQGVTGWMALTGEPGGPPAKTGLSLVDFCGGYVAAMAILAGVYQARRDGRGIDCDVSLYESALAMLNYVGMWTATAGYEPSRTERSAHPSIVPFQLFAAADGFMVVACPKEKFWQRLVDVVDDPALRDQRFATMADRLERRDEVVATLDRAFVQRSVEDWVAQLRAVGVPCGPINDVHEALQDAQAHARGALQPVEHPRLGVVWHMSSPLRVGTAPRAPEPAPARGQDTATVLRELCGYSGDELDRLGEGGAFGNQSLATR